jgi:hypothetical protein
MYKKEDVMWGNHPCHYFFFGSEFGLGSLTLSLALSLVVM